MTGSADSARRRIILAWTAAVLYMALIWTLSSFDLGPLSFEEVPFHDKGIHFMEYGALAFLVAHAVVRTYRRDVGVRTWLFAVGVAVAWGLLDEIHQAFVPGRTADLLDLAADSVGAVAGAGFRHALHLLGKVRRTRVGPEGGAG